MRAGSIATLIDAKLVEWAYKRSSLPAARSR